MDILSGAKTVWRYLGRADKAFLLVLLAYLLSGYLGAGGGARLLLLFGVIVTASVAGVKWLRLGIRKAIWRLRNRLLVAYLFIALVPILLIGILAVGCSWALAGQIAVYLVSSELDQRMEALARSTATMAQVPRSQRSRAWERVSAALGDDFPSLDVLLEESGEIRFPAEPAMDRPAEGWGETSGLMVRDGLLYVWARAINGPTRVTTIAPVTRAFLVSLAPGLGDVTILDFASGAGTEADRPMRPHDPLSGEPSEAHSALPPPKNRFDYDIKRGASITAAVWDAPPSRAGGLLSIHCRFSSVLDVIFSPESDSGVLGILYLVAAVFVIVELISLFIGVSITRTITGAFHFIYDGTEKVREGDFSHRIEVHGNDQLAVVSDSFNRMTENLERLFAVAKDKERMEAELEIAQAVQRQLYPKSVPALAKLELRAVCNPALMVSGDYYDYQALQDSSVVVAIGDVAGKGISAALLMATLQSSLRTHVRGCIEGRETDTRDGHPLMSTSSLVSQLNEQIYADTSPEKYATFFFSVYDDETGILTYTNAGHLPPILFRDGTAKPLDVNGMVVGAFPFAQYDESQVQLQSGDLLVGFTDGITEPENEYGEMFGEERVVDVVSRNLNRDVEHIIKAVMEAVLDWTGSPELQDDMTILVARRS